jgi:uncharacterized protein YhfF
MTDARIEAYWNEFLATQPPDSPYHDRSYIAEGFGDNPALADELAALVLSGVKTATCSALWEWEAEGNPIPEVGLLSITLSGAGDPICILETTEVTLRRYNEVDEDFACNEGEGDLSLAYWREAHKQFFSRVLTKIGREFSTDMPLVCEQFRVIHQ